MNISNVFHDSPRPTEPALPEVALFFHEETYGRAGAWDYELSYQNPQTYQEHKLEAMGLLTDCEQAFHQPAITAAHQAITKLKGKCRIGLDPRSASTVEYALWLVFDKSAEDKHGRLGDFKGVPEWSELLEAMSAHSIYFVKSPLWYQEHGLIKKVQQKLQNYIETQPDLKQRQLAEKQLQLNPMLGRGAGRGYSVSR